MSEGTHTVCCVCKNCAWFSFVANRTKYKLHGQQENKRKKARRQTMEIKKLKRIPKCKCITTCIETFFKKGDSSETIYNINRNVSSLAFYFSLGQEDLRH